VAVTAAVVAVGVLAGATGAGAAARRTGTGGGATPAKGAILRFGTDLTPGGGPIFDPGVMGQSAPAIRGSELYTTGLYDVFVRREADGTLRPGLATKWDTSDPSIVVVHLREGVKFQDGTAFDAAAVKLAWDRTRSAKTAHEPLWDRVSSVEVAAEHQVRVTLTEPSGGAFVVQILATEWSSTPSPTAVAKYGDDYRNHPVGAGPYAFESYQEGQKVSLRAWSDYWDPKGQRLGGIDMIQTAQGAPAVASVKTDLVDLVQISYSDVPPLQGQPGTEIATLDGANPFVLIMCTSKAPFDSLDARRAIATGLDRDAISEGATAGTGVPAETLFPKGSQYYAGDLEHRYPYRAAKAKRLARTAGVTPGTPISIMTPSSTSVRVAEIVQSQLGPLGFDASIHTSTDFLGDLQRTKPDIVLLAGTPPNNVQYWFKTGGVVNWCGFSNDKLDDALATIQTVGDGSPDAVAPWHAVQEVLQDELPWVVVYREPILYAHESRLRGVAENPGGDLVIWKLAMSRAQGSG
jgi:ABC-type transport system substrate-binding protein